GPNQRACGVEGLGGRNGWLPSEKPPAGTERRGRRVEGAVRRQRELMAQPEQIKQLVAHADRSSRAQLVQLRELARRPKDGQRVLEAIRFLQRAPCGSDCRGVLT